MTHQKAEDPKMVGSIKGISCRLSGATSGIGSQSRLVKNRRAPILRGLLAFALVLFSGLWTSPGAESSTLPPSPSQIEGTNLLQLLCTRLQVQETNLQQLLRADLQLQEQLHATQLAIEQDHQETKEAAAQNAEALSKGLQVLQEAFSAQGARDLEATQRSNKVLLLVVGSFAALGFLTLLIIACLQWRASKGLAEISAALPTAMGLGTSSVVAALGPAVQSNLRLLGAMEQLDQRIHKFERGISPGGNGDLARGLSCGSAATGSELSQADEHDRISLLLNQAQSLMNSDNPDAALACLDGVLSLDPNHTEALVKKGVALERLHKLNEALECYDRAIAVDGSMTLAYLHKGGLCNRLERFKEALECYEKALRTQDQRAS
jgi:tetratricopeptide (TPR) repeat protein